MIIPKQNNQPIKDAMVTLILETANNSRLALQDSTVQAMVRMLQPGQVVDQYRSLVITGPRRSGHSTVIKTILETRPAVVLLPGKNDLAYFNYPANTAFYWRDFVAQGSFQRAKNWELVFIDNWRTGVRSINLSDVFQVTESFKPAPFYVFLG